MHRQLIRFLCIAGKENIANYMTSLYSHVFTLTFSQEGPVLILQDEHPVPKTRACTLYWNNSQFNV